MENNTDSELVVNVKRDGCEQSLSLLIRRHTPLCFDISKKYAPALRSNGIDYNDVVNEKEYLIYKSALSYNPDKKTKFSTWLGNQVRYHCLNTMNKNNLIATEDSQLAYFIHKRAEENVEEDPREQMDFIFNIVKQLKDKRIQKILHERYFSHPSKKTPWNKVAQRVGVSTQTAINLHTKVLKMLKKKMKNKNAREMDRI